MRHADTICPRVPLEQLVVSDESRRRSKRQGGLEIPFQQAQRGQLAQQSAQTQLLQSQSQMVPKRPTAGWGCRDGETHLPALVRAGATIGAAQIGAQSGDRRLALTRNPARMLRTSINDSWPVLELVYWIHETRMVLLRARFLLRE